MGQRISSQRAELGETSQNQDQGRAFQASLSQGRSKELTALGADGSADANTFSFHLSCSPFSDSTASGPIVVAEHAGPRTLPACYGTSERRNSPSLRTARRVNHRRANQLMNFLATQRTTKKPATTLALRDFNSWPASRTCESRRPIAAPE